MALELSNLAIVNYPNCIPVFIEKIKIQFLLKNWDETIDTVKRYF